MGAAARSSRRQERQQCLTRRQLPPAQGRARCGLGIWPGNPASALAFAHMIGICDAFASNPA